EVRTNQTYNGQIRTFSSTPGPLAAAMKDEIPGVVSTCRTRNYKGLFGIGDKSIYESSIYTDASLFDMLSLTFTQGSLPAAFSDMNSIVITEKMAHQFFGNDDNNVIGKSLKMDNKKSFTVSGVIRDIPENSTLKVDCLIPFKAFEVENDWLKYWGANGLTTFIELSPTANPAVIAKQLSGFIRKKSANEKSAVPVMIAMKDWRLRNDFTDGKPSGGRIEYVRLFTYIACIILLIACINFMNLATARSEKRAREVGVRKVLGAERSKLIFQFIGESVLLSLFSVIIGAVLISLLLPAFNLLVKEQLSLGLDQPLHILSLLGIALVCGLVAGSYPALYLSGFNPIQVLKRLKTKEGGAALTRKTLVVLQFSISIFLIVSTVIVYRQVQHIKTRNLGYNKDGLFDLRSSEALIKNYAAVKEDLMQTGVVSGTGLTDMENLYTSNNTSRYTWATKDPQADILISIRNINQDYLKTMGMELIDGRNFKVDAAQDSNQVIITEALAKMMGAGSAVGKTISADNEHLTVVGVVKDYIYGDFYGKPDPVIFYNYSGNARYFYIRVKENADIEKATAAIGAVMKRDKPG
ncbi:MAG: ABC transporter permease, partial [Bacteroidetes bacterium]|nr:ABC transporter permease [Bacteroidota bacterium]